MKLAGQKDLPAKERNGCPRIYFEGNNVDSDALSDLFQMLISLLPAFILGWLIPPQVLHRLVKRYRTRLQEALPDTVDLLGIVLGTGLALDQAMMRVSEEMEHIYPELAAEFYTVTMQVKAGQELKAALASCKTVLVALAVASALINVLYLSGSIYMLDQESTH